MHREEHHTCSSTDNESIAHKKAKQLYQSATLNTTTVSPCDARHEPSVQLSSKYLSAL